MKRFQILTGFLLGAALLTQVATADDHHDKRYYGREGKDYHVYNNQEDRAYRAYLGEQHRDYREFRKVKRSNSSNISDGVTNTRTRSSSNVKLVSRSVQANVRARRPTLFSTC